MANHKDTPNRGRGASRRRRQGVPVLLTILLIIMALMMGGLGGFVLARRTDTHIHQIRVLEDRVTELENTLTLIGFPLGDDVDPAQWAYDRVAGDQALTDLSSDWPTADADDFWNDESLIDGTLPEDADPVVVAEFEGGELFSNEVIPEYNDRLTTLIFSGHSAEEVAEETLNTVLMEKAGDKIIALRAAEMGMTDLSDSDVQAIQQQAQEDYEALIEDEMTFSQEADMTRERAMEQLAAEGVTPEGLAESLRENWWTRKYFDEIVKDVSVSDEEIRACYDRRLARQRQQYAESPEDFEYDHMSGELILVHPEGYRAVRDILIPFDDAALEEVIGLSEQLEQGNAPSDAQARLDALYAPLEEKAREALKALEDGQSFAQLMDVYGCDPALETEPMRSEGYYINADSFINSQEYVDGSMMLESPGQVSTPLRSVSGVHLVEYIGDVAPGDVPFEEVRDAVAKVALTDKQTEYY
ncbi:MAG: hypothetical protein IJH38_04920, partial [Clostridia bacterium]|nr:hypothetical protein [Clostridia bacterium]